MTTRVRCGSCEQMVVEDDVHSCFDAQGVLALRDAERAVVEAAKAWLAHRHGPRDVAYGAVQRALASSVEALVALEEL